MNTKLRAQIETAIDGVIQRNAENCLWSELIPDNLSCEMAKAAELVFDASQEGQKYAEENK